MKSKLIAAAIVAGLASPAAASTFLDFTSAGIGTGNTSGNVFGVGYTISAFGGNLVDATHKNDVGCDVGYSFSCAANGNSYDVGFGVSGAPNGNEIDGINGQEYVEVAFTSAVKLLGFASMLTYNDSQQTGGTEWVRLAYSTDGITFANYLDGVTQNTDADNGGGNDTFGTVGLSYLSGQSVNVKAVRFFATGTNPYDDGNSNITAAGLEVAAVPVPAALPLLLAGVGAFGFAARRNKRKAS